MTTQKTRAFKIGLFVITALAMIVVGLVFLGSRGWNKKFVYIETYINESVQGLDVGAPVKYRGVQIGVVTLIDFVDRKYPEIGDGVSRRVLVEMGIYPETFDDLSDVEIHNRLRTEANKGLRVRLKSQGLTGIAYIEADYLDPTKYLPMNITWIPDYCYVPYTSSLSAQLQESADSINVILRNLRDVDIGEVVSELNTVILNVQEAFEKWQIGTFFEESIDLVKGLKTTNMLLQKNIVDAEIDEVAKEIRASAITLTQSVLDLNAKDLRSEISASLSEFQNTNQYVRDLITKEEIDLITDELSTSLSTAKRILENTEGKVVGSLDALQMSSTRLYRTTKKLDHILSTEHPNVELIIDNIRTITEDLRELTQYAKKYPSHILFGDPPNRQGPTR